MVTCAEMNPSRLPNDAVCIQYALGPVSLCQKIGAVLMDKWHYEVLYIILVDYKSSSGKHLRAHFQLDAEFNWKPM